MQVTFMPANHSARTSFVNTNKNQIQNVVLTNKTDSYSVANNKQNTSFAGWRDWVDPFDWGYYFAQKLRERREKKKEDQFKKLENIIHNDAKFYAERNGLSLTYAQEKFDEEILSAAIPLKKNGREEGLNKIVGFSVEKYQVLRDVMLPLVYAKRNPNNHERKVPNGVMLYGPPNTGKTHFAKAMQEHIELKGLGDFREFILKGEDLENNNYMLLYDFFEEAKQRYKDTGERQILFFDDLHKLFDEDWEDMGDVFLGETKDCSKNGITWIGTTNFPQALPDLLYKPSRLSVDINIDKLCDGEKSAIMSYFWIQKNRKDDSDHDNILSANADSGFHYYPPEVAQIARSVDEDLTENSDRKSYLDGITSVRKPVTTALVNKYIKEYKENEYLGEFQNADMDTDMSKNYKSIVYARRVQNGYKK